MGQKLGIVSFTEHGSQLNERLREMLERSGYVCESYAAEKYAGKYHLFPLKVSAKAWTEKMFQSMDALLFIGACGIAVRSIAPYLQGKDKDPAVVVLDERGIFAISLLSGHLGGANELTAVLANLTGAIPVITTATDINGRFAVDVFAKKQNLWISDLKAAKAVSAAVLDEEPVGFFSEFPVTGEIPCELQRLADGERFEGNCGMVLSLNEEKNPFAVTLHLIPRIVSLGIGCKKGTPQETVEQEVLKALQSCHMSIHSIFAAASIDLKKEEEGLLRWCMANRIPFLTYSAEELKQVKGDFQESSFVREKTGVDNVCERAAMKAANEEGTFILRKQAENGMTIAIVKYDWKLERELAKEYRIDEQ